MSATHAVVVAYNFRAWFTRVHNMRALALGPHFLGVIFRSKLIHTRLFCKKRSDLSTFSIIFNRLILQTYNYSEDLDCEPVDDSHTRLLSLINALAPLILINVRRNFSHCVQNDFIRRSLSHALSVDTTQWDEHSIYITLILELCL